MNKLIEINKSEIMIISGGMNNGNQINNVQNYQNTNEPRQKDCIDKVCEVTYNAYTTTCDVIEAIAESRIVRDGVVVLGMFALGAQVRHQVRHWDD